jgi:hypothetical protein
MIVILIIGNHIQDQRWIPQAAECCSTKQSAVKAVGHVLA